MCVDSVAAALLVPGAYDLVVDLLFERFMARARLAGADTLRSFMVGEINRRRTDWELRGPENVTVQTVVNAVGAWADGVGDGLGDLSRDYLVVNAAGALADRVAVLAGVKPLGPQPLERTTSTSLNQTRQRRCQAIGTAAPPAHRGSGCRVRRV